MFAAFVLILLAALVLNFALSALLLWLAARLVRLPQATYLRSLATTVLVTVIQVVLLALVYAAAGPDEPLLSAAALLVISLLAPFAIIRAQFGAPVGKSILAGLLWYGLSMVLVVPAVFLLRFALFDAYVIPTGAMAETLRGYHKQVSCPKCDHSFTINGSAEADPLGGLPTVITGCTCPNCRYSIDFRRDFPSQFPSLVGGDRVLVSKGITSRIFWSQPARYDLIVFRYPAEPARQGVPINYIKRLIGLPGETIGIWYGDLFVMEGADPSTSPPTLEAWKPEYMQQDDALDLLMSGSPRFHILRKPPEVMLALRRIVYDNDHQARDPGNLPPRWAGEEQSGWSADGTAFRRAAGEETGWLRYRHILRGHADELRLITDFLGYNTYVPQRGNVPTGSNWAGDLMLEAEVTVEEPAGELVLELSRGVFRFRARFDLASGECTLLKLKKPHEGEKPPDEDAFEELERRSSAVKGPGAYGLRFANFDQRLTLWVNDTLPFGDGVVYDGPASKQRGPYPNDLQPASIGVTGAGVMVSHLKLWRDTYYTIDPMRPDTDLDPLRDWDWGWNFKDKDVPRPDWGPLHGLPGRTFYVQPGHYLCLGDNSTESSDSRSWGTVPQRLLIGRAMLIYFPPPRSGAVR
jgi:signal peptidase I